MEVGENNVDKLVEDKNNEEKIKFQQLINSNVKGRENTNKEMEKEKDQQEGNVEEEEEDNCMEEMKRERK